MPDSPSYKFPGYGELLDVPPDRLPEMGRCLTAHIFVMQALEEALVEEEELTREEFRSSLRDSPPVTWHDDETYTFAVGVEGGDEMIEMDYSQIIRALYPEIHLAEAVAGALDLLRGGDSPGDGPGEEVAEILEEALAQWSAPLGIEDISEVQFGAEGES